MAQIVPVLPHAVTTRVPTGVREQIGRSRAASLIAAGVMSVMFRLRGRGGQRVPYYYARRKEILRRNFAEGFI
jgi:hypothetical protein